MRPLAWELPYAAFAALKKVMREMHMKSTMKTTKHLLKWRKLERNTDPIKCEKDVELLKPSYTAGGNVKMHDFRKKSVSFLES